MLLVMSIEYKISILTRDLSKSSFEFHQRCLLESNDKIKGKQTNTLKDPGIKKKTKVVYKKCIL